MNNAVKERYLLKVNVVLSSPLTISAGTDNLTDNDIIRDFDGTPIVPGTSIAGAMRDYCGYTLQDKCYFGYEKIMQKENEDDGKMSSYFISDLEFSKITDVGVRDSVALSDEKIAVSGAKFDHEILEKGSEGSFYIEIVVRENENSEDVLVDVKHALYGIDHGDIRFGMKKTRGLGKMEIRSIYSIFINKDNAKDWFTAYEDIDKKADVDNQKNEWILEENKRFVTLEVPLGLTGGISIRTYQAKKYEPDFKHIESNGNPVMPGTSIAGAIRSRVKEFLIELEFKNVQDIIDIMFGYVLQTGSKNKKSGKQLQKSAQRSNIVVDEVDLKGSHAITMVRNGISRFEGSARDKALFKEKTYVGGKTKLMISVRKDENACEDYKWQIGLLLLAIKDLQRGYLAIGGATAVGRGIFEKDGKVLIDGIELTDKQKKMYYKAIVDLKGRQEL